MCSFETEGCVGDALFADTISIEHDDLGVCAHMLICDHFDIGIDVTRAVNGSNGDMTAEGKPHLGWAFGP